MCDNCKCKIEINSIELKPLPKTVSFETFKVALERLIWCVCLNYASEQISIGKACELLNITSEEFRKIFETFPYDKTTKDSCKWIGDK